MNVKRLLATTAVLSLLLGSVPVTFDSADGTLSWQEAVAAKGGNGKGGGKGGGKGSHGDGSQVSSSHEENGDSLGKGHGTPGGTMDGHGGQVNGGHGLGGHTHGLGHGTPGNMDGHGGQVYGGHGEYGEEVGHTHGLGENKDTSGVDAGENQEEGQDSNGGSAESDSDVGDVVESAAAELESTDSN